MATTLKAYDRVVLTHDGPARGTCIPVDSAPDHIRGRRYPDDEIVRILWDSGFSDWHFASSLTVVGRDHLAAA